MQLRDKNVLVTGASGLVGGHLAARLATEAGARVRALVRPTSRVDHLQAYPVELCRGDVTQPGSLPQAFEGVDVVYHCAAIAREWGRPDAIHRVNALGTANVLAAAAQAGVARLVHISSVAVYGLEPADGTDETFPFDRESSNPYASSKIEAEDLAMQFHRTQGLPVTILRPADVYGPRSVPLGVGPLLGVRLGWMELIDGGEGLCNHLYVGNLVDACLLAAESDAAPGQAYIISDGVGARWRDFFGRYSRMAGKGPLPSISRTAALHKAAEAEAKAAQTGRPPVLTQAAVMLMTQHAVFKIEKAERELGYSPRISLDEGMRLTEEWFREKGYL